MKNHNKYRICPSKQQKITESFSLSYHICLVIVQLRITKYEKIIRIAIARSYQGKLPAKKQDNFFDNHSTQGLMIERHTLIFSVRWFLHKHSDYLCSWTKSPTGVLASKELERLSKNAGKLVEVPDRRLQNNSTGQDYVSVYDFQSRNSNVG